MRDCIGPRQCRCPFSNCQEYLIPISLPQHQYLTSPCQWLVVRLDNLSVSTSSSCDISSLLAPMQLTGSSLEWSALSHYLSATETVRLGSQQHKQPRLHIAQTVTRPATACQANCRCADLQMHPEITSLALLQSQLA
jgi:hypothetical protein